MSTKQAVTLAVAALATTSVLSAQGITAQAASPPGGEAVSSDLGTRAAARSSWTKFSTGEIRNTDHPALARTANEQLHVVYGTRISPSQRTYEHATFAPSGNQVGANRAVGPWDTLTDPDLEVRPDGGLTISFSGLDTASNREGEGYLAGSDATGAAWTVVDDLSVVSKAYASTGSDTVLLTDGTPVTSGAQIGGLWWRQGTVPSAQKTTAPGDNAIAWPCCAYYTALAHSDGEVYLAWYSNANDQEGIYLQRILPTVGPLTLAPRSRDRGNGNDPGQKVAMVSRPGGGVVLAYLVGYPTTKYVALWDAASGRVVKVPGSKGAYKVGLASGPSGRLWVTWYVNGTDKVYGMRTAPSGYAVGGVSSVRYPSGEDSVYQIGVEGSLPAADVVINTGDALYHRQLLPGLQLKAKPKKLRKGRQQKVRLTVTDAGDRVKGAKVKAQGTRCRTNKRGVCRLTLPARGGGKVKVTAKKSGYEKASLKLKVRR